MAKMAKKEIEEFNFKKNNNILHDQKTNYLKTNVYFGLQNKNDGFDSESIYHFSESDFEIIIERTETIGIEILGIEVWLNNEFCDVKTAEDYKPTESKWYRKAFSDFKKENPNYIYSASYNIY